MALSVYSRHSWGSREVPKNKIHEIIIKTTSGIDVKYCLADNKKKYQQKLEEELSLWAVC